MQSSANIIKTKRLLLTSNSSPEELRPPDQVILAQLFLSENSPSRSDKDRALKTFSPMISWFEKLHYFFQKLGLILRQKCTTVLNPVALIDDKLAHALKIVEKKLRRALNFQGEP